MPFTSTKLAGFSELKIPNGENGQMERLLPKRKFSALKAKTKSHLHQWKVKNNCSVFKVTILVSGGEEE